MAIALVGASSQIARDLILSFAEQSTQPLSLFVREPQALQSWLATVGLQNRYAVADYGHFGEAEYQAVINFVGVGDPAKALRMGGSVLEVTWHYDTLVLDYLRRYPHCRYLFLSSGAVYGSRFMEPVNEQSVAQLPVNALTPQDYYGIAKLHAECRHRACAEWPIVDLRVFNYFSHTQDLAARFLITDLLRAILRREVVRVSPDYIVRDFLHPADFYRLVCAVLQAPPSNLAVDCYTLAPVDKPALLAALQEKFALQVEMAAGAAVNATGSKPHYYSLQRRAAQLGYQPQLSSLQGIVLEAEKVLRREEQGKGG
ncbi:NAD-dependent epimerase/dehydratase family protein [Candidatus Magnetaquicoccus inordinatus]|uniref:NAD-dependent epimerase/dehydratase family protein n=1 Tax=Candidatus Magnetaquicoccus inordinatus TaxID=2496818 RepID=UPI00102C303C|nr:NAD-dependent epimerase/dehydratase family protein [Candidatus Magnetaquicoccus inordinatus]